MSPTYFPFLIGDIVEAIVRPTYLTTRLIEDSRDVTRYDLGGHTHFKLDFHFVWRTKRNRKILGPQLAPFLVEQIEQICKTRRVVRLGLAIATNHVHLCARLRPSQSPSQVMLWIKSVTSKNTFERFPRLEARLGSRTLWGSGYHVESLGDKNVFAILAYLGKQDEKHDLRALEPYMATIDAYLDAPEPDAGGSVPE